MPILEVASEESRLSCRLDIQGVGRAEHESNRGHDDNRDSLFDCRSDLNVVLC